MMASHWNSAGDADGTMSKFWGLFLMPIVVLGMFLLFMIIPKIDPLKKNIEKFRKHFDWFIYLIMLFMLYIYILTILWNKGYQFNMTTALLPAMAVLFYMIGIVVSRAKRNWFIGIRNPWTLSSDVVWAKTHKLGGILFKIMAVIILIAIPFKQYAIYLILIPVLSIVVITLVYSYLEYQKESRTKGQASSKKK